MIPGTNFVGSAKYFNLPYLSRYLNSPGITSQMGRSLKQWDLLVDEIQPLPCAIFAIQAIRTQITGD